MFIVVFNNKLHPWQRRENCILVYPRRVVMTDSPVGNRPIVGFNILWLLVVTFKSKYRILNLHIR